MISERAIRAVISLRNSAETVQVTEQIGEEFSGKLVEVSNFQDAIGRQVF